MPIAQNVRTIKMLLAFTLLVSCLCGATTVYAVKAPGGFSGQELKSILPLLRSHGVVGLSEFESNGDPKAMTLAVRINAPRDTVFKIFEEPENFYYLSTLFKENKVLDSHDGIKAWSWASRHKFFSFTGTNSVALYPPKRADVSIVESTIGSGRFTLRFYKDGEKHTIFVVSGYLDVQSSEWLIRFLVGGNPAMKQAMNIAIGLVVVKGTKAMAERLARGKPIAIHKTHGEAGGVPTVLSQSEINRLTPLLKKGQVFMCDSHKHGRLRQATVIDRVNAPASQFVSAARIPGNYAKHISAISNIEVHNTQTELTEFSWTLGFSIFGIKSKNTLQPVEEGVLLSGIEGDLKDARWRWQVVPDSDTQSIVAYHSYADVAKTSGILKSTVKREPYLEHGLVMGSNIVMLKAMKKLVENQ